MRLPFPDLLATKNGRLAAFFLLYVTEGIPLGFTAMTMATQMRRQGFGPAAIGAFSGALSAVGVQVGGRPHRRCVFVRSIWSPPRWIIATQLGWWHRCSCAGGGTEAEIAMLTLIIAHNVFAATQDVAIDALAVGILKEDERGVERLMFAGASSARRSAAPACCSWRSRPFTRRTGSSWARSCSSRSSSCCRCATGRSSPRVPPAGSAGAGSAATSDVRARCWRAFTGSRAALVGVVVALLPAGAIRAVARAAVGLSRSSWASPTTRSRCSTCGRR